MRSMRLVSVVAPALAIFGLAVSASGVAAASTAIPLHLVKDCSTFDAVIPSYCTISGSNLAAIPVGAKVAYLGPVLDNVYFLSSNVLIDDAHGSTATGYCIFDGRATEQRGICTFWAGTGSLKGFSAILDVSIDAAGEWHLDGVYYGDPPPVERDPWRLATPRPS